MTPPGDYLEFQEGEPVRRMLEKIPELRQAIHNLYGALPHSLAAFGRLRQGTLTVGGQPYMFLLLRHGATKVSILTVAIGDLSQTDLDYFRKQFK